MKPNYAGVMSVTVNPTIRLVTSVFAKQGTGMRKRQYVEGRKFENDESGTCDNSGESGNLKTLTIRVDVNIHETSFSSESRKFV